MLDTQYFPSELLEWFDLRKRELPWRKTDNPYAIWVSEVILQQTRVEQGRGYFLRFMEAFPTVQALAAAPQQEVLRLWQGLGYYSRARNLWAGAQQVVAHWGGQLPSAPEDLRKIKGIGPYTAGAIASIAFGRQAAVVDGNVYRVLSRLTASREDIATGQGQRHFAQLAQQLVPAHRPGDYNQALMELGALVCKPNNPGCAECPVATHCRAREQGVQSQLPVKTPKTKVKRVYFYYLVLAQGDRLWMKQRHGAGIWQGLWDFPLLERSDRLSEGQVISLVEEQHPGWVAQEATAWRSYTHLLSHRRIQATFVTVSGAPSPDCEGQWLDRGEREAAPKPVLVSKYLTEAGF